MIGNVVVVAYCAGVVGFSVLIRVSAKQAGREYEPQAALVACVLWPGAAIIVLLMLVGMFLTWVLRLDGMAKR